ncbi:uncharacterized protein [Henckelia pumila]|uniref:uncharacterized protein n=1 Tax=Henckelia pumila TaxID=405737 RepID=UPI003C6DF8A5
MKFDIEKFIGKNDFALWRIKMKAILIQQGLGEALKTKEEMSTSLKDQEKIQNGKGIEDQIYEFIKILDDLKNVKVKLDDEDKALILLNALPKSYEDFKDAMLYGRDQSISLEEVKSTIQSKELQTKIQLTGVSLGEGLKELSRKKKKVFEKQNDKGEVALTSDEYDTAEALVVADNDTKNAWILDSGCTYHMCLVKSWFEQLTEIDQGMVLLGNDKSCKVKGIGTIRLQMHDGTNRLLKDVRFVQELKRNLIYLETLESNGYSFKSEAGMIKVFKGLLVVMKGKRGKPRVKFGQGKHTSSRPLEHIHSDLWGPSKTHTHGVKNCSIRLITSIVTQMDFELEQLDVKTSFLHGDLEETIFMEPPEGYHIPGGKSKAFLLKRFFYGRAGSYQNISLIIDDRLIASRSKAGIQKLKGELNSEFDMKDLGEAKKILGMKIQRNGKKGNLFLSQGDYIAKVLLRFNMQECKSITSPLGQHMKLSAEQSPTDDDQKKEMESIPYTSGVGIMLWCVAGLQHWGALKWILRHLKGSESIELLYQKQKDGQKSVEGCVDFDYAGNIDTRKSLTGYVFTMYGTA